jgi:hypothetical protein
MTLASRTLVISAIPATRRRLHAVHRPIIKLLKPPDILTQTKGNHAQS